MRSLWNNLIPELPAPLRDPAWLSLQRARQIRSVWRPRVRDDRGALHNWRGSRKARFDNRISFGFLVSMTPSWMGRCLTIGGVYALSMIMLESVMWVTVGNEPPQWLAIPMVPWAVLFFWWLSRSAARAMVCNMLRERVCAACQYEMGEIPASEDGCTVCPECGGAWRLPATPGSQPDAVSITSEGSADSHR